MRRLDRISFYYKPKISSENAYEDRYIGTERTAQNKMDKSNTSTAYPMIRNGRRFLSASNNNRIL